MTSAPKPLAIRIKPVRCKDGRDVGEVMVEAGYAVAYRQYGGKMYDAAEKAAKDGKCGLWAGSFVPPWEWRLQVR